MKNPFRFLRSDTFFYLFFAILILALSYLPTFYRFFITPDNRVYSGAIFYTDDYAIYASVIEQGIDGRLSVLDKYTSEPHPASLIHFHYLVIGHIGRLLGLSSVISYHLARLVGSLIFILIIVYFLHKLVPKNLQRLSFLFILIGSGWPNLSPAVPTLWQKFYPQFINPDPAIRLAHQPHFLLGNIYTLITILFFTNLVLPKANVPRFWLLALAFCLFTIYVALADPAQTLLVITTIGVYGIFLSLLTRDLKTLKFFFPMLVLTVVSAISVFIYLRYIRTFEPWKTIALFDAKQEFPPNFQSFFAAFGPTAIFATIGILTYFSNKLRSLTNPTASDAAHQNFAFCISNFKFDILVFWLLSALILIFPLSVPLGINRLRFFNSPLYIPISIFSAYGIYALANFTKRLIRIPHFIILNSLFLIPLLISLPVFTAGIIYQIKEFPTSSALIYPPKTHVEAFNYLKTNTNRDEVVLGLYEAANQIPYLSGNTSFIGNISETLNEPYKSSLAVKIFNGALPPVEVKKTLDDNNIKYLFIGYQEGAWQIDFTKYPFLTKFYQNPGVTIFKRNEENY